MLGFLPSNLGYFLSSRDDSGGSWLLGGRLTDTLVLAGVACVHVDDAIVLLVDPRIFTIV